MKKNNILILWHQVAFIKDLAGDFYYLDYNHFFTIQDTFSKKL